MNALDLSLLARRFLRLVPFAAPRLDQNGDGVVNALDLSAMGKVFLTNVSSCP